MLDYREFDSSYTRAVPLLVHRAHISSTCLSVTADGAMPSDVCVVSLYAPTNRWSTSTNLLVFLNVNYLYNFFECSVSPFNDRAFYVRFLAHFEPDAFALQHILKRSVLTLFSSISLHPYRPPVYRLRVSRVFKNRFKRRRDRGPVFDFRGTTWRYFE